MIKFSPRWVAIALAAALTASPVLHAAAQAVQGPVAPAAAWQKLIDVAVLHGKHAVDTGTKTHTYTFRESITDPAGDVQTFEVLLLATPPKDGRVTAVAVLLSLTQLKSMPGNAALSEQWFLEVTASGRLQKVTFEKSVTRAAGIFRDPPVIMGLADAETKALFNDLVSFWTQ